MSRIKSPFLIGYSVLAGPITWFAHFIVVYAINEFGCRANFNNQLFLTPANYQVIVIVATAAALIAVGFGGVLAYRRWQSTENHQQESDAGMEVHFLAIAGVLLSALFLFAILMTAAPALVLPVCDRAT